MVKKVTSPEERADINRIRRVYMDSRAIGMSKAEATALANSGVSYLPVAEIVPVDTTKPQTSDGPQKSDQNEGNEAPGAEDGQNDQSAGNERPTNMMTAADEITKIKGLGEGTAMKLAELGVTTFAQIAAWTDDEVKAYDERLGMNGRIARGEWPEQAKKFAAE